jgi:phage terminase small subunit
MKQLSEKEKVFVAAYIVDLNALAAAKVAKYRQPRVYAYRVLARPHVQESIRKAKDRQAHRLEVKADDVIRELVKIGFQDIRKAVRWGRSPIDTKSENASPNGLGNFPVELVPSEEIDDDTAAAIAEVSLTERGIKIKMHDKRAALESLGKHFGIFEADNRQRVPTADEVKIDLAKLNPADAAAEWARLIAQDV